MTISPPDNSFKSSGLNVPGASSSVRTPYELEQERKFKLWQASPEGQAAAATQASEDAERQLEYREYFIKQGLFGDDSTDSKQKKSDKHHQKHPPHKKTGFLNGLTEKFKKK